MEAETEQELESWSMSAIKILFYLFGTIFFFSALAFAHYAFRNARLMQGPLGHQLMAVGGVLFMVATIVGAVDHFFFPGSGLVYAEFFIWIAGLSATVGGGMLRAKEIQRAHRVPLFRILIMMPSAKIYLIGIVLLVFISLPISILSALSPLRPEPRWFNAGNIMLWAFAFAIMAMAERRFYLAARPSAGAIAAGVEKEEEMLLREDILALRAYSDLTSRLLTTAVPMTGIVTLRYILGKYANEHDILKDCEMTDKGTLMVERAAENLVRIPEKEGAPKVFDGFSSLILRLIDLHSAIASPDLAQEMVARNYQATKERYGEMPILLKILETMPKGFLEEEKLALLSKEELEAKVKERTGELEEALMQARKATEALRASQASFHNIVERSTDGIIVVDRNRVVRFINPAAESFFDRRAEELVGEPLGFPILTSGVTELDIIQGLEKGVAELRVVETEWEGETAYLALLRDITERKQAERQIAASLKEKEVLLTEIHHRVKNNLQIISSLLHLRSKDIKDKEALEMFKDSQNRIRSIALVHEELYQSKDLARIDFAEYVRNLTNYLFWSYGVNPNVIKLKTHIADVSLDIDTAIPCGLILNELVSNTLKHAFPGGREGEIRVGFRSQDGQFALAISDNGIGFPAELDFRRTESLGLQLVIMLVEQLEGSIELDRKHGTTFKIAFTAPQHKEGSSQHGKDKDTAR